MNETISALQQLQSQIPGLSDKVNRFRSELSTIVPSNEPIEKMVIDEMNMKVRAYHRRITAMDENLSREKEKVLQREKASREQEEAKKAAPSRAGSRRPSLNEAAGTIVFNSAVEKVTFELAIKKLRNERKELRCMGVKEVEALYQTDKRVIQILYPMLNDLESSVRTQVLDSLGRINAPQTISMAAEALNDDNIRVRLAAIRTIYKLAGGSGLNYLTRALDDSSIEVREQAVMYLGRACDTNAIPVLLRLIDEPNKRLRKSVFATLSGIRDKSSIPAFIRGMSDKDTTIRDLAVQTLKDWTGRRINIGPDSEQSDIEDAVEKFSKWWGENRMEFEVRPYSPSASPSKSKARAPEPKPKTVVKENSRVKTKPVKKSSTPKKTARISPEKSITVDSPLANTVAKEEAASNEKENSDAQLQIDMARLEKKRALERETREKEEAEISRQSGIPKKKASKPKTKKKRPKLNKDAL